MIMHQLQSGLLNKSLESAQKKVESFYYDSRKQLFEYDQALKCATKWCVFRTKTNF